MMMKISDTHAQFRINEISEAINARLVAGLDLQSIPSRRCNHLLAWQLRRHGVRHDAGLPPHPL
jgi:hypothetical protein